MPFEIGVDPSPMLIHNFFTLTEIISKQKIKSKRRRPRRRNSKRSILRGSMRRAMRTRKKRIRISR